MAGDALLVPVGHDLGVLYLEAGSDERRQQVRAGVDVVELDDRDFAVWLLAHGVSDDGRPTRSTVLATAELVGLERQQVEAAVDRLLADGLLVAVEPQELSAVGFAEQHQLFPLVIGLGPDSENAMLQTIGLLDQPLAQLSNSMYDLWMWAHLAPNLWTACHDVADLARRSGVQDPDLLEPRQVLTEMLGTVHGLLATRTAYFDRRTRQVTA